MNNYFNRLSRRERLVVLIAAVALFIAGILYPAWRSSSRYRQEKLDELESARSLGVGYQAMLLSAEQIRAENTELKTALGRTDGLLFDRVGNDVMMEASIIKLLNQLAPDLGLEISLSKPSLRGVPGQLNFSVRGNGRYPEVLNFLYKLETHRPLIGVDTFNLSAQAGRGALSGRSRPGPSQMVSSSRSTAIEEPSEPRMRLKMDIHINTRTVEEKRK